MQQDDDFFPWSDDYAFGIRVIDTDHQELVSMLNTLHRAHQSHASADEMNGVLQGLMHYVAEHFEREEALMEEYGYPGLARHRLIHRNMRDAVWAFRSIFAADPAKLDTQALLDFLKKWLEHHILQCDKGYVPYILNPEHHGEAVEQVDDDEKMVTMTITLPAHDIALIEDAMVILTQGGAPAHELARKLHHLRPIEDQVMRLEEANAKLAKILKSEIL